LLLKGLSGLEVGDDVEQFLDDNAIRQVVKRLVQILQQLVDTFLSALHRSQATGFSLARDSAHALKIGMKKIFANHRKQHTLPTIHDIGQVYGRPADVSQITHPNV
jgi:hypothetical protein